MRGFRLNRVPDSLVLHPIMLAWFLFRVLPQLAFALFSSLVVGLGIGYLALDWFPWEYPGAFGLGLFKTFLVGAMEGLTPLDQLPRSAWAVIEAARAELYLLPMGAVAAIGAGLWLSLIMVRSVAGSVLVTLSTFLAVALPMTWWGYQRQGFRIPGDHLSQYDWQPTWLWIVGPTTWGLIAAITVAWLVLRDDDPLATEHVRGARVESGIAKKPKRRDAVREAIKAKGIAFAGEVLPHEAETKHVVALGTTGTGKSTAGQTLIRTAIERGDRMVIADPGGDAMSRFWREGDTILNPFDARSAKWDLFAEIEEWTDYDRLAEALLPLSGSAEGDEWVGEGRTLLSCLMRSYHGLGAGSSDDFARVLLTGGNALWAELCEGTEAAVLFEDGNERMRGSVINKLKPATKLLNAIANGPGRPFSVRQWVREGGKDKKGGRLWLPYRLNQLAALRGAIGTWMSVAVLETLSLPEDRERRIWFVADELDVLGTVPDLDKGLTNGRRFGACFVLGFQSIAQLEKNYGRHLSRAIIENCSTKLILRCEVSEGGGTAEFASRLIGDREIVRAEHSDSSSRSPGGETTGSSTSYRHATERAVMASEITQLADRTGFLRIAGADRWRKVAFPFNEFGTVTKASEPVKLGGTRPAGAKSARRARFMEAAE